MRHFNRLPRTRVCVFSNGFRGQAYTVRCVLRQGRYTFWSKAVLTARPLTRTPMIEAAPQQYQTLWVFLAKTPWTVFVRVPCEHWFPN